MPLAFNSHLLHCSGVCVCLCVCVCICAWLLHHMAHEPSSLSLTPPLPHVRILPAMGLHVCVHSNIISVFSPSSPQPLHPGPNSQAFNCKLRTAVPLILLDTYLKRPVELHQSIGRVSLQPRSPCPCLCLPLHRCPTSLPCVSSCK